MARDLKELERIFEMNPEIAMSFNTLKMHNMTPEDYALYLKHGMDGANLIEEKKVKSSNINQVTFDGPRKKILIEFKTGAVYEYDNVPRMVFKELVEAQSVGKYFAANIKGRFAFRKVR